MPFVVPRYPAIVYDGTNSAAVLAMVNNDNPEFGWTYVAVSETGGVLHVRNPTDPVSSSWLIRAGDLVIGSNAMGGLQGVATAELAAAYWMFVDEATP